MRKLTLLTAGAVTVSVLGMAAGIAPGSALTAHAAGNSRGIQNAAYKNMIVIQGSSAEDIKDKLNGLGNSFGSIQWGDCPVIIPPCDTFPGTPGGDQNTGKPDGSQPDTGKPDNGSREPISRTRANRIRSRIKSRIRTNRARTIPTRKNRAEIREMMERRIMKTSFPLLPRWQGW